VVKPLRQYAALDLWQDSDAAFVLGAQVGE
jgi:hypothetical protein